MVWDFLNGNVYIFLEYYACVRIRAYFLFNSVLIGLFVFICRPFINLFSFFYL